MPASNSCFATCAAPAIRDAQGRSGPSDSAMRLPLRPRSATTSAVPWKDSTGRRVGTCVGRDLGGSNHGQRLLVVRSLATDLPPLRTSAAFAGGAGTLPVEKPNGTGFPQGTSSSSATANTPTSSRTPPRSPPRARRPTSPAIRVLFCRPAAPSGAGESGVAFPTYRTGSLVTAIETIVYYIRPSASGAVPRCGASSAMDPRGLIEGVDASRSSMARTTTATCWSTSIAMPTPS